MERYKYTAILFLLLSLISFVLSGLQAASDSFCDGYIKESKDQYQAAIKAKCDFSGLRWNDNYAGQRKWCLTIRKGIAESETQARDAELATCEEKQDKELSYQEKDELTEALIDAAKGNDIEKIKRIVAKGGNLHRELGGNFGTPLFHAIAVQAEKAVKYIVDDGGDPNSTSNGGPNPLSQLVANDDVNYGLLEFLLKNGSVADGMGELGSSDYTPLNIAIRKNDAKSVEILLKNGASPNFTVVDMPPIFYAIEERNVEILTLLLKHGANPNITKYEMSCDSVNNKEDYENFPLFLVRNNVLMVNVLNRYKAKGLQRCIAAKE